MITPLLEGLRQHFPHVFVAALVSPQAIGALKGNPSLDRIFLVPSGKRGWQDLLRELRRERFDTAFIVHRFFVPSLLATAAGIPRRLGFYWRRHGFALTAGLPFSHTRSQVAQISDLMTLLDKSAPAPKPVFHIEERQIEEARDMLKGWRYDPARPLVGIHPGGGQTAGTADYARRWLPASFGQLADMLAERDNAQVVLSQGPGDEAFVEATLAAMKARPWKVLGNLDLAGFGAIVSQLDVMVTNDSAPMHIAAARGIPVVAIFGPSHPGYHLPTGSHHAAIWAGVSCSPCHNPDDRAETIPLTGQKVFQCWLGTHECMKAVAVEQVYAAVKQRLPAFKGAPKQ